MSDEILEKGLRQISLSGRISKGCNGTIKAILKRKAQIVFLADDVDNKDYKSIITGLCKKYNVNLVNVPQKLILSRAFGFIHPKAKGGDRVVSCGVCAVTRYGSVESADIENFRAAYDPETKEHDQE